MIMASAYYRAGHQGGRALQHQVLVNPVLSYSVHGLMTQAWIQSSLAGASWNAKLGLAA